MTTPPLEERSIGLAQALLGFAVEDRPEGASHIKANAREWRDAATLLARANVAARSDDASLHLRHALAALAAIRNALTEYGQYDLVSEWGENDARRVRPLEGIAASARFALRTYDRARNSVEAGE